MPQIREEEVRLPNGERLILTYVAYSTIPIFIELVGENLEVGYRPVYPSIPFNATDPWN